MIFGTLCALYPYMENIMDKKWRILLVIVAIFWGLGQIFKSSEVQIDANYKMKHGEFDRTYRGKTINNKIQKKLKANFHRKKAFQVSKTADQKLTKKKKKKRKLVKKKQGKKKTKKAEKAKKKTNKLAKKPTQPRDRSGFDDRATPPKHFSNDALIQSNLKQESTPELKEETKNKEKSRTLEQWVQYILSNPTASRVNEFINLFNKNKISANIYYAVIEKMLSDERETVKDFAIVALSATPTLQSFFVLSEIANDDNYSVKHKQMAKDAIVVSYTSLAQVNLLNQSLHSDEAIIVMQAAILIKTSAEKNLVFNNRNRDINAEIIIKFQNINSSLAELLTTNLEDFVRTEIQSTHNYITQRLAQAHKDLSLGWF